VSRKVLFQLVLPLIGLSILFWLLAFAPGERKNQPALLEMSVILRDGDGAVSTMRRGMEQAAVDLNVELRFLTPSADNSAIEQTQLLERETAGGTQAILLLPADRGVLGEAVSAAAGRTALVTVETDMTEWGAGAAVTMDHQALGEALGEAACNGVPTGGTVLLLDSLPGDNGIRERMLAARETLERAGRQVRIYQWSADTASFTDILRIERPGAVVAFEAAVLAEAAELGTTRVIREHSTIGIVITTDGSITDIPREDYLEAEGRVIRELQEIGKPFLVLLNAVDPKSSRTQAMASDIASHYGVCCLPVNCLELDDAAVGDILKAILYEFPLTELELHIPAWVLALPADHAIKLGLYRSIREGAKGLHRIREVAPAVDAMCAYEGISGAKVNAISLGSGTASAELQLPRTLFYQTLSEQSGFDVADDGDLMRLLTELSAVKADYDKVSSAIRDARETGYGVVVPTVDELILEEPEIMKQGGRYGVRLKASAPSIHMIRANIETTVSPIVGNEKQSEDMVNYLLQEFEGDTAKIWQSNIFGRSFHEIVSEDLQAKLKRMPDDARAKLRQTLERIINEGSGGLICIIL